MTIFTKIENFLDDDILQPIEKGARWIESTKPVQYFENVVSIPYNTVRASANAIEAIANESGTFVHKTAQNIENAEKNISESFKYLPYFTVGLVIFMILK